jgi:hypothetical protein
MKIVPPSATAKNAAKKTNPTELHEGWLESLRNEKRGMIE